MGSEHLSLTVIPPIFTSHQLVDICAFASPEIGERPLFEEICIKPTIATDELKKSNGACAIVRLHTLPLKQDAHFFIHSFIVFIQMFFSTWKGNIVVLNVRLLSAHLHNQTRSARRTAATFNGNVVRMITWRPEVRSFVESRVGRRTLCSKRKMSKQNEEIENVA